MPLKRFGTPRAHAYAYKIVIDVKLSKNKNNCISKVLYT